MAEIFRVRIDQVAVLIFKLPVGRREDDDADIGESLLYHLYGSIERSVPGEQIDVIIFIQNRALIAIITQIVHHNDHIHGGEIHAFQGVQSFLRGIGIFWQQRGSVFHQGEISAAEGSDGQIQAQRILWITVGIFLVFHGYIGIRKCTIINGCITSLRDQPGQPVIRTVVGKGGVSKADDIGDAVIFVSLQEGRIQLLHIIQCL